MLLTSQTGGPTLASSPVGPAPAAQGVDFAGRECPPRAIDPDGQEGDPAPLAFRATPLVHPDHRCIHGVLEHGEPSV